MSSNLHDRLISVIVNVHGWLTDWLTLCLQETSFKTQTISVSNKDIIQAGEGESPLKTAQGYDLNPSFSSTLLLLSLLVFAVALWESERSARTRSEQFLRTWQAATDLRRSFLKRLRQKKKKKTNQQEQHISLQWLAVVLNRNKYPTLRHS